jgi:hypothetical protein
MKNKQIISVLILIVIGMVFISCPNPAGNGGQDDPTKAIDLIDPAFWFGDIYSALINRVGEISSEEYSGDMGQIVNCQYVVNAINAKWGTNFVPAAGIEFRMANCEYLLKMIDKANNNTTSYGTSAYATTQLVDKTAVDTAVATLWVPGEKFVAISYGDKAAYSADGINWSSATLPSSAEWRSVTYGNGMFVAITCNSDKAAYSTDGVNWSSATLPSSAVWYSVTYGNGIFVAVAFNSNKATYSVDGINWSPVILPSTSTYVSVVYGDDKFVVITLEDTVAYSTDGINWQLSRSSTFTNSVFWQDITYGNGKFIAVANSISINTIPGPNRAIYSNNGILWYSTNPLPSSVAWKSITYGNSKFVAIANNDIAITFQPCGSNRATYSTDGINWSPATLPNSEYWNSITYGSGKFVAVAASISSDGTSFPGDKAAYSPDGINWFPATLPSSAEWYSVTYGGY